jgi:hypothetical protein
VLPKKCLYHLPYGLNMAGSKCISLLLIRLLGFVAAQLSIVKLANLVLILLVCSPRNTAFLLFNI